MRDGGEGRGNVTVNMGQLSLSFLSLFVSHSHLTLDFVQTDQREVSSLTMSWQKNPKKILLHLYFYYIPALFLPQRSGSRITVWSVGVVLFPSAVCNLPKHRRLPLHSIILPLQQSWCSAVITQTVGRNNCFWGRQSLLHAFTIRVRTGDDFCGWQTLVLKQVTTEEERGVLM